MMRHHLFAGVVMCCLLSATAEAQFAQLRVTTTAGCEQGSCQRFLYYATAVAVGETDAAIVFATASHTFEQSSSQTIHLRLDATNNWVKATSYTPRAQREQLDIALVYVARESLPQVPLLPIIADNVADTSTAELVSFDGSETTIRRKRVRITNSSRFDSSVDIQQGNSGGPIVNESGEIVGLVWAHGNSQTDGYMVEAAGIRSILATMKVRTVVRGRGQIAGLLPPVPPQCPPPLSPACPVPGTCPPGCQCASDLAALRRQVNQLSTKLNSIEKRPRDDPVDLGPLSEQVRNLQRTKIPVRVWRQDSAGQWQCVGSSDVPLGEPIHLRLTPQGASR